MIKAVYAGTFDPPTYGHLDIISRGIGLFDSLDVVIAVNLDKSSMLSLDIRKSLLTEEIERQKLQRVVVNIWDGLIVDYCRNVGAQVLLRGARSAQDYTIEFEMANLNRQLFPETETVILPARSEYSFIRSSVLKEIIKLGGNVSQMLFPEAEAALKNAVAPKSDRLLRV